jgi:hypothetical protein
MYIHLCSHPFWGLTSSGISGLWWATTVNVSMPMVNVPMVNMSMVNMPMVNMLVVNIKATPAEFKDQFSELQDLSNSVAESRLLQ